MFKTVDLSVIIVSYNTIDLIEACLCSVIASDNISKELFVVDNASTDGSPLLIKKNFPHVHLTTNNENRGFAAANNQVLPECRGRYIFFLNPDTRVMPNAFKKAIAFMDAHPYIGLAGAKMVNPDASLQESVSYRYPGEKHSHGEVSHLKGLIACVLGAGMIARGELIKDIGGFDEDFFLYGEDQDLCLRIRKLGYEIGYIDSVAVEHLGAQSERKTTSAEFWKKKVAAEYLFHRKHYLPETIARIRRADLLKSLWRIVSLKLTIPFMFDKKNAREKLIKYQVTYKTIKQNKQAKAQ
jgi:N-acetylglucosaminyl-diphospho-decaprenol L-rhamnosyltransferase